MKNIFLGMIHIDSNLEKYFEGFNYSFIKHLKYLNLLKKNLIK